MKSIQRYFINVIRNQYAAFEGRVTRREYWMFTLFSALLTFVLIFFMALVWTDGPITVLTRILQLVLFCPTLAMGIRRMHDTGRSGWWVIVPVVSTIFALLGSETTDNKWGRYRSSEEVRNLSIA